METNSTKKVSIPGKYTVRRLLWNLYSEGEPVSDPDRLHLLLPAVQDPDAGGGRLRGAGDADHVRVSDRHHAEGDVLAAGVVGAAHLVDFVGLGHDHAVPLHHHRVGVHPALHRNSAKFVRKAAVGNDIQYSENPSGKTEESPLALASAVRDTHGGLGVAVLARHGEVQPATIHSHLNLLWILFIPERVAVDDVHVTSLAAAKCVDPAAERLVGPDVHHDPGVLAVHRHWGGGLDLVSQR